MADTLEIGQNPTAVKLRGLLSDPDYQELAKIDPAKAQAVYRSVASGGGGAAPTNAVGVSTAMSGPRTATFRKQLSAAEQMQVAGIRSTQQQLIDLRQKLQALGADKWNRAGGASRPIMGVETAGAPTRFAQAWGRRHGMSIAGGGDPDIGALNKLMGQITTAQGQTEASLMKAAGTRNFQFIDKVRGHLPDPVADFQTNMDNVNFLLGDTGPYQTWLSGAGVSAPTIPPLAATPTATPTPGGASGMSYEEWKKLHGG
jgi:hypothetical protein